MVINEASLYVCIYKNSGLFSAYDFHLSRINNEVSLKFNKVILQTSANKNKLSIENY